MFEVEHSNVLTAQQVAAARGWHTTVLGFAEALWSLLWLTLRSEELGVTAAIGDRVLRISSRTEGGVSVQEVFLARLRTLDEAAHTGEEWTDARRGDYEVVRVPIHQVDTVDLKPAALRGFVLDNIDVLVAEAANLL
ncbi:hypothetical protein [Umezawaea sp. Da 62-37]|uniref:hypothetical protein n=1 Tax=Umezawaea sp. Da 62-37 TaxID=3075927 RepID=UPI0028F7432A|nr:hypothetical protein [Umezawaea sp. Da 62-37]WNV84962.1 hypothetical protein RM788_43540 [Umezawaea sp. Da 62-37]